VAAMESKEVPDNFPTDLVYDMEGTKVFEVFNNDSEDRTFMSLDIKTPDDQYFLMGFYDGLLEVNDRWEIKSREESDVGGIYKLIDKEGVFVGTDITVVKGQYDELTTILISTTRFK